MGGMQKFSCRCKNLFHLKLSFILLLFSDYKMVVTVAVRDTFPLLIGCFGKQTKTFHTNFNLLSWLISWLWKKRGITPPYKVILFHQSSN